MFDIVVQVAMYALVAFGLMVIAVVIAALIVLRLLVQTVALNEDQAEPRYRFRADPHDPDMVLPAAWPAHNVTDMNGRPYFVGRP